MPCHDSFRFIASAIVAGLMAMPAALAQTAEPTTPPAAEEQAQPAEPTTPPTAEEQAQPAPSEEQLESFAEATILIVRIQEEAQQRMQSAVEEAGLTLEQYNGIARAAQADPELDQALQTMIRERLGG